MLPRTALAAALAALLLAAPAAAQIPLPIPTVVPTVVPGLPSQGPARPALPGQRRQGLPRRPAARHARALQRRRAGGLPRDGRDGAALLRPARHVPRPDVRDAGADRRAAPELLQGLELRRARRPGRARPTPRAGTSRSCATAASACRTSTAPRATARCSARATRPPRTGCSSWTSCATRAARELSELRGRLNAAMDAEQWEVAPYTEADLERQATQLPDFLGADGKQIQRDVGNYIAGINTYIAETQARPVQAARRVRGARPPGGPAALEGGRPDRHGVAGRRHLRQGRRRGARRGRRSPTRSQKRFGKRKGLRAFRDFRSRRGPRVADDGARASASPTSARPKRPRAVARPDRGSLKPHEIVAAQSGGSAPAQARPASACRATRCRSRSPTPCSWPAGARRAATR